MARIPKLLEIGEIEVSNCISSLGYESLIVQREIIHRFGEKIIGYRIKFEKIVAFPPVNFKKNSANITLFKIRENFYKS